MGFQQVRTCRMDEIASTGFIYAHPSGARLLGIRNNDENRVFSITFKTPPTDDRGAAHIVEHCVLCGSRNYPVKDPFNELAKSTLHTYLNAITFWDKTMYPVAGYHEPDFMTMMDVYLDSVFSPLIERKAVFLQEGWHRDASGRPNGIVLNEMIGTYADPVWVLERTAFKVLFPENCYRFDAAGVPSEIPKLCYADYVTFYKAHYTPSNSFIYLYGNVDMEAMAAHIDACLPTEQGQDVLIADLKMKNSPVCLDETYVASEERKRVAGAFFVLGDAWDCELAMAAQVLFDYLLKMPNAPLRARLLEMGAGKEITGLYNKEIMHPVFGIICKDTDKNAGELKKIIRDAFTDILDNLDYVLLSACMNQHAFSFREENHGYRPKGLAYNISMLSSWLYDRDPFEKLDRNQHLNAIREKGIGFFQDVIKNHFIYNPHSAFVSLWPGNEQKSLDLTPASVCSDPQGSLNDFKLLTSFQASEDTARDLERIPLSCLPEQKPEICHTEVLAHDNVKVIHHGMETNDIIYVDLLFSTRLLPQELLPYVWIMGNLLTKVPTKRSCMDGLNQKIRTCLGGIGFDFDVYSSIKTDVYTPVFIVSLKAMTERVSDLFQIAREVLQESLFVDKTMIYHLLCAHLSELHCAHLNNGDKTAVAQALTCVAESERYRDTVKGLGLYFFLKQVISDYDACYPEFIEKLRQAYQCLFNRNNLTVSLACIKIPDTCMRYIHAFAKELPEYKAYNSTFILPHTHKKIGMMIPSEVGECAMAFDYRKAGYTYTGGLALLGQVLSTEYFLKEIRHKGGAYGCGGVFYKTGLAYFYSYRDPQWMKTLEVFEGTVAYLAGFFVTERELRKFLSGTMNQLLKPLHPIELKKNAIANHFSGITPQDLQAEKEGIACCGLKDIRDYGTLVQAGAAQGCYAAMGSVEMIKQYPFDVCIDLC